jgi:hypothetical protein
MGSNAIFHPVASCLDQVKDKFNCELLDDKNVAYPVECNEVQQYSCLVEMAELQAKPFSLKKGDLITVRINASNK